MSSLGSGFRFYYNLSNEQHLASAYLIPLAMWPPYAVVDLGLHLPKVPEPIYPVDSFRTTTPKHHHPTTSTNDTLQG